MQTRLRGNRAAVPIGLIPIGLILIGLALVAPPRAAGDDPPLIYRGRMGDRAILHRVADRQDLLVRLEGKVGDLRLVSFDARQAVLTGADGKVTLPIQAGGSAGDASDGPGTIPPYPHAVPGWWQATHDALETLQLAPDWRQVPATEVLRQLVELTSVPMTLTPAATLKLARRQAPVDLRTGRMPVRALLDLLATLLGLSWWAVPDGIQLDLPGRAPRPPAAVAIQDSIAFARRLASQRFVNGQPVPEAPAGPAATLHERLAAETVDDELTARTLAGLIRKVLAPARANLVIDPAIATRVNEPGDYDASGAGQTVAALLAQVAERHQLGVLVEGSVVQVTDRERATRYTEQQQAARAQLEAAAAEREALGARPLGAALTDALPHALAAQLSKALEIPVYTDAETWRLAVPLSFPARATIREVLDGLVKQRIYPVFVGRTLILVRGA